jgi:hypothetical protein
LLRLIRWRGCQLGGRALREPVLVRVGLDPTVLLRPVRP